MNTLLGMHSFSVEIAAYITLFLFFWGALFGAIKNGLTRNATWQGLACATLIIASLWMARTNVIPGFSLHVLGSCALVIMFGWRGAILGGVSALFIAAGTETAPHWAGLALDGITSVVIPASAAWLIKEGASKFLSNHLFVRIFAVAFFGAGLSAASSCLAGACMLTASGVYEWGSLDAAFGAGFMMAFVEGWTTCAIITILTIWWPESMRHWNCPQIEEIMGRRI